MSVRAVTKTGIPTARGFAVGPVFVYRGGDDVSIPEYAIAVGGETEELTRLRKAMSDTRRDLEGLVAALRQRAGREDVRVFEGHLMLLEDPELVGETERYISEEHLNAEAAVVRTFDHARSLFERMNDSYFRERVRDFVDIERRLVKALTGFGGDPIRELKVPSIIVADDLTPSETVRLPRDLVLGFATDNGSATSHVALLARALGIPAVTGLGNITECVTAGETVILDGAGGEVTLKPSAEAIRDIADLIERQKELVEEACGTSSGTLKDGGEILLFANVHPGVPLGGVREFGAGGIGLYRSEYLWLNREIEPTEEQQFEAYRSVAKFAATLGPKATVTIRVLDIGGDKLVRGISAHEANPFLGNRSIRYLLSNRDVFRTQLRAILRASAYGPVCLLYPMISCVDELKACREVLDEVRSGLKRDGVDFDRNLPVGVMIEVPSAALNADALAKHVQFFSIGTNDLVQYTMAADRGNQAVANLYQPTNPAVLKLMRMAIAAAKRHDIRIGVCGESAADPVIGVLWAAMGIDVLSMSSTYIPVISKLLSRLTRADLDEYRQLVEDMSEDLTAEEILARCREWMQSKVFDFDNIVL